MRNITFSVDALRPRDDGVRLTSATTFSSLSEGEHMYWTLLHTPLGPQGAAADHAEPRLAVAEEGLEFVFTCCCWLNKTKDPQPCGWAMRRPIQAAKAQRDGHEPPKCRAGGHCMSLMPCFPRSLRSGMHQIRPQKHNCRACGMLLLLLLLPTTRPSPFCLGLLGAGNIVRGPKFRRWSQSLPQPPRKSTICALAAAAAVACIVNRDGCIVGGFSWRSGLTVGWGPWMKQHSSGVQSLLRAASLG